MVSNKNAFWQALVFTIIIFLIGLLIGFFIETSRTNKIETDILSSEINLLDAQIRNRGIGQFEISCELSKQSTLDFANKVYAEALQLEQYEATSKLSAVLKVLHKRYDLLRTLLWIEAIEFKKKCPQEIHTIVYLFEYDTENIQTKARQASTSRLLLDLKSRHESEVLLLPIAGNLNIEAVNLILQKYEISKIPAIIIDEKIVLENSVSLEELERLIFVDDKN